MSRPMLGDSGSTGIYAMTLIGHTGQLKRQRKSARDVSLWVAWLKGACAQAARSPSILRGSLRKQRRLQGWQVLVSEAHSLGLVLRRCLNR